jgi:hypothetical protein
MIPEDEDVIRHEETKPKPKADPETLAYLERLPYRPFGAEW